MENFTALRNGLLEHIQDGKLCPFDLGIYVYVHLRADWSTGIFHGCALGIAHGFNDPSLKHHINKSLIRLRERQYINYRKGDGRRGGYEVLIHKYQVTVGELSGMRLNAWKHGVLCQPEYERWNGAGTVEEESRKSGGRVGEPIQDLLDINQDLKTTKTKRGAVALADWIPTDAWLGFVEMRKKARKPLTERAQILIIKKLENLRAQGQDIGAVLDQSTTNSWQDVYAVKGTDARANRNRAEQRLADNLANASEAIEILERRKVEAATDPGGSGSVPGHANGSGSSDLHRSAVGFN